MTATAAQRLGAEFLGALFLLAAVVGSGIMAERLAGGSEGLALLANTLATGGALIALILAFGPLSGAHFNPAVTLFFALRGQHPWRETPGYVAAQLAGAVCGVLLAHAMFDVPVLAWGVKARAGLGQWLGEATATCGLLLTIWGVARAQPAAVAYAVAGYIVAAYWFTSSTSFANPAVTAARALTPTFAGIAPGDAPAFVAAQLLGLCAALCLVWVLEPRPRVSGR